MNMDQTNNNNNDQIILPVDTDGLDENTTYRARLEFTSIGSGAQVRPNFVYSHNFPDEYDGEFPSSFLAMRDMAIMLNMMVNDSGSAFSPEAAGVHEVEGFLEDLEASDKSIN